MFSSTFEQLHPMAPRGRGRGKISAVSGATQPAKVAKVVKTEPITPATNVDIDSVNAKHHMAIKAAVDVIIKRFKKVNVPLDLGDNIEGSVIRGAQAP